MWSSRNGVGTAMMKASASGISVVAVSRPMRDRAADPTARSGSTNGTSPSADRLDGVRVDVDADDLDAAGGQRGGGRQADVAEADDRDAAGEQVIHADSSL